MFFISYLSLVVCTLQKELLQSLSSRYHIQIIDQYDLIFLLRVKLLFGRPLEMRDSRTKLGAAPKFSQGFNQINFVLGLTGVEKYFTLLMCCTFKHTSSVALIQK